MVDIPFTTFAFPATGAPTNRTMPVRFNDFINVLDFGADPTGAADSHAAFTAAIKASRNQQAIADSLSVFKATCTGATISNGSGGSGDILAFTATDGLSVLRGPGTKLLGIGFSGSVEGLLDPETYIIAEIDPTHFQLNRSLSVASTTIYVFPDEARFKNYGIVYVPRGNYLVSDTVELIYGTTGLDSLGPLSFTLLGESAGSTKIFGDFNDWILATGFSSGMTGGFIIENLSVHNENTTPYTSGCIFNGGQCCAHRNLILSGMVGLAMQSATMFGGGAYGCVFKGPGLGIESLGLDITTSAPVVNNCHFTDWDTGILVGLEAAKISGNVFERNRVGIDLGGHQGIDGHSFQNSDDHFGSGQTSGTSVLGNMFRSNGISIKTASAGGHIIGNYIDCTPATGINPTSGNNVQDGIFSNRWSPGMFNNVITGTTIDGFAYNLSSLKNAQSSFWAIGLQTDVPYAKRGGFPPLSTEPAEAKAWNYTSGSIATPVWTYAELPWGQVASASIDDTTLSFSNYDGRGLEMEADIPSWVFATTGTAVAAGTKPSTRGTTFSFPIVDSGDGTGAAGNVLTFLGTPNGPPPIVGATFRLPQLQGHYWGSGYIDDGSGDLGGGSAVVNSGNVFTITDFATLTGATISGDIVTFSSISNTNFANDGGGSTRLAIGIDGAGGIPRDTFLIQQGVIGGNTLQINRELTISTPTTMYLLADYRPGYQFNNQSIPDAASRAAPTGSSGQLVGEINLFQWEIPSSTSYGPSGPLALTPLYFGDVDRHLVTQLNAQQWEIDGTPLNVGVINAVLPNTYFVNISQDTGAAQTMTFFKDYSGHIYEISDSPVPAWTGSSSNVGQVVTTGGGSYRVRVRFEHNLGYVIAG